MENPVLLFDGVCNLCNRLVVFILKHEKENTIRFAPLQSDTAVKLLKQHKAQFGEKESDTIVLILDGKVFLRSEAAFKIAGYLKKPYSYIQIFHFLPSSFRNFLYNLIANYRHRIFGMKAQCMVPEEKWRDRFLI